MKTFEVLYKKMDALLISFGSEFKFIKMKQITFDLKKNMCKSKTTPLSFGTYNPISFIYPVVFHRSYFLYVSSSLRIDKKTGLSQPGLPIKLIRNQSL